MHAAGCYLLLQTTKKKMKEMQNTCSVQICKAAFITMHTSVRKKIPSWQPDEPSLLL